MTDRPRTTEEFATLDCLPDAEGTGEAFRDAAIREVLAWQVEEAMKKPKRSRKGLAERMLAGRGGDTGRVR